MVGSPGRIFRRVIIEATARYYFTDAKCSISHNRYGEFAARYKALDQHLIAETPTPHFVAPRVVVDPHDANPDAGTLVSRFYDKRGRNRIISGRGSRARNTAGRSRPTSIARTL